MVRPRFFAERPAPRGDDMPLRGSERHSVGSLDLPNRPLSFKIRSSICMSGFLSDDWRDVLAIGSLVITSVGVLVTLVAFLVAIVQIRRAVSSAKAAADAAEAVREEMSKRAQVADLSSAVPRINEIHALITASEHRAASLRLNDLRELMIQIRTMAQRPPEIDHQFQESLAQVSTLEKALSRYHHDQTRPFDPVQAQARLRDISDFLNTLGTSTRME